MVTVVAPCSAFTTWLMVFVDTLESRIAWALPAPNTLSCSCADRDRKKFFGLVAQLSEFSPAGMFLQSQFRCRLNATIDRDRLPARTAQRAQVFPVSIRTYHRTAGRAIIDACTADRSVSCIPERTIELDR